MKTYKELKHFCETNNVRYEVNPLYSKPYEYPAYEDGKCVWKVSRTILGFEFGMNNISGRKGRTEWNWVWYETLLCPKELEDDTKFCFRNRYNQAIGKNCKGWREEYKADMIIERRSKVSV